MGVLRGTICLNKILVCIIVFIDLKAKRDICLKIKGLRA